jgi:translation initiation factor IF-3
MALRIARGSLARAQAILPKSTAAPCPTLRHLTTSRQHLAAVRPKNDEIPFNTVQLVSSETNTLSPPTRLSEIQARYPAKTHTISLVSSSPPIVRVFAKTDLQKADRSAKEKAKAKRKVRQETTELQVTWESAEGDLRHKLNQGKHVLESGDRLDLVFSSRGKNASAAPQFEGRKLKSAQEMILGMFERELGELGVKRKEDMKGGTMVTMFYEPNKDLRQQALDKAEEAAEVKAKEKQARKEERRIKEEERRRKAQVEEEERRRKLGLL